MSMRTRILLLAAAAAIAMAAAPNRAVGDELTSGNTVAISLPAQEVVRLAESGVEEGVILAFVDRTQQPFALQVEDVIYLNDLGISAAIVTAMLRRDAVLQEQGAPASGGEGREPATRDARPTGSTNATVYAAAPQPVYVTNAPPVVVYFHDSLAPYGIWIELADLGWCWQPRIGVIDRTWRPYLQGGCWLYTNFGWYWRSDYSWGWAPFHYGRWQHHHRHGWVWFPDLAWAPAWVSWRTAGAFCGWAPLPPGAHFVIGQGWRFNGAAVSAHFDFHLGPDLFTYVELRHLAERRPDAHALPAPREREIHGRSTVFNDCAGGPNGRIINRGVDVARVVAASGREIPRATVREVPPARADTIRHDGLARIGQQTLLSPPPLRPPANPGPTSAQRVDERHSIIRPVPRRPSSAAPPHINPPAQFVAPERPAIPPQRGTPSKDGAPGRPTGPRRPPASGGDDGTGHP